MSCRCFTLPGLLIMWVLLSLSTAMAAPPSFERRAWTRADNAPQTAYGIAQDADGVLWFATATGLYQYDGAHFTRQEAVHGHRLRSNNVIAVAATADGLAVGYQFGGASVLTRAAARHYTTADGLPAGSLGALAVDAEGTLYAGASTGVARLHQGKWTALPGLAAPQGFVLSMLFDGAGTLWLVSNSTLYAMPQGQARLQRIAALSFDALPSIVHGRLVTYTERGGLTQFSPLGVPSVLSNSVAYKSGHILFEGPQATVWAWLDGGTTLLDRGAGGVLHAAQTFDGGGLPGRMVSRTLVDREENLWVTTLDGVERYRRRRLHELPLPATAQGFLAAAGPGSDILVGSSDGGPVWQVSGGEPVELPGLRGVTVIHRQNAGSAWLGGKTGLYHLTPAGTRQWPLPPGVTRDFGVQAIVTDRAGKLWVAIARHGLFRFENGSWSRLATAIPGGDDTPVCMLTTASGRTWVGYTGGRLGELTAAGVRLIGASLAGQVGNILSLVEQDGRLLVGGERGVAWLHGDTVQILQPEHMAAFLSISGMGVDRQGDLWLHGPDGLFHVGADQLQRLRDEPARPVQWEVFNYEDGLRGQVAQVRSLPSLTVAADGKVYYATGSQVGWIDPANIRRNARAPTVLVQSLRTGSRTFDAAHGMTLAAGTTSVEIRFAATALSIPERVRVRYRLLGVEQEWQEPQLERAARYTNLGPGSYRFQVTAANEDGIWNDAGAVLEFSVAPTLWQSWWFRAAMVIAGAAALFLLYRWRIVSAARRSAEKMAARTDERERIARNLHDNLLQGVHGLILTCHAVLMRMPKGTPEEKSLGAALARADQMVEDTRDEVMNLRRETARPALVTRLDDAIASLGAAAAGKVAFSFSGCVELLEDDVAGEIFFVLQEAIVNSVRHAGARCILVALQASAAGVVGSVADDGCGMPAGVMAQGRAGHWGLPGMRERIERLGGALRIDAGIADGTGCTVSFNVPASVAYQTSVAERV
jgi:signal transduction histidine kinase/ligand-binding sensor domain-containing protein